MVERVHLFTSSAGVSHFMRTESDGKTYVDSVADVEAALDVNKAMATHNDGYSPSRELRRAFHIPAIILVKWQNEIGYDPRHPNASNPLHPANSDFLKRKLNDPDWAYLRTAPGRI